METLHMTSTQGDVTALVLANRVLDSTSSRHLFVLRGTNLGASELRVGVVILIHLRVLNPRWFGHEIALMQDLHPATIQRPNSEEARRENFKVLTQAA